MILNGNNKLPLLYQILHVSQLHHDIIPLYYIKYFFLISCQTVGKEMAESRNFKSMLGSKINIMQLKEII